MKTLGEAAQKKPKRRVEKPKTPRQIQLDELRRRRAKAMAPSEGELDEQPIGPKPFVRETIAASIKHFCWFCFENERELLVAGTTGVHFCRECARSLVEVASEQAKFCWFCERGQGRLIWSKRSDVPICEACVGRCVDMLAARHEDGRAAP